ncbi:MAG: phosphate acyltransferase PlsX [Pseudomonadota bacterium]
MNFGSSASLQLTPSPDAASRPASRSGTSGALTLAVDAMGGDSGPQAVVDGVVQALRAGVRARFKLFGDEAALTAALTAALAESGVDASAIDVSHTRDTVSMTDKPSQILRRGRDTSMWRAIDAVRDGAADAVVSCGNTGALMAVAYKQLGVIPGVDRPAITALWPSPTGPVVVLDVGANVEADADQLVQFAIMGEAFARAVNGKEKPVVGLLNVGAEELKGHGLIRTAAKTLREADPDMAFHGFVEGDDISQGVVDVVVTDGFSGNIALKSAEGAARLVGAWLKESLTATWLSKLGALLMMGELRKLRNRMDPSSVNGGVFLGVNGVVVKSHGGADAKGVASAVAMAASLAEHPIADEISRTLARVAGRAGVLAKNGAADPALKAAAP